MSDSISEKVGPSKGLKPLTIYGNGDTIVCVEDILSAIKIARLSPDYCATPLPLV